MRLVWTDQAFERLEMIEGFVAKDSPAAALELVDAILAAGGRLPSFPLSGRVVPELARSSIRELLIGNYRIVYRVNANSVEILTVFEGHMQLPMEEIP